MQGLKSQPQVFAMSSACRSNPRRPETLKPVLRTAGTNPDESPAGTLAYEFSKSVANYAGHSMDMIYITLAFKLGTDGLIALDIKSSFVSQFT